MKAFVLLHTEAGALPKAALEALGAACGLGLPFSVGILGQGAAAAADAVATCGATGFAVVDAPEVAQPRYASDAAAAAALIQSAGAEVVIAPQTSRFARCLPGVAARLGMAVDTHIVSLAAQDGAVKAQRWFYRQRILSSFSRAAHPWMLLVDSGVNAPWQGAAGAAQAQAVAVDFGESRTTVTGVQSPAADAQTIRPEAALLFVAGAGWTKKQRDGQFHIGRAGGIIQTFLAAAKASLGSSKSLVDLKSEGQETLGFMSHMNQVGQTGSTPRHLKGLSTCCHGEEPHAVGWRFITERRAINLDPNCGWAQGKADVVYVGDAFEIMEKVNALLQS
ncbi:MAG: electron transfer flavoprotein subunit alpha [Kiritimatiellaeota bacterium]|nr:electron transfer flavoprotein subunit alpha [Kiritimatiellota bacterium]